MAAGGPQSATFAGRRADGLITSVKDPAETIEKVIDPFKVSSAEHGNAGTVLATRWTVFAEDRDQAWEALGTMRGLRAEGRLEAVDPMVLRERADAMDRDEILDKYTIIHDVAGLIEVYRELVTDVGADGGFKWWRQHLEVMEVSDGATGWVDGDVDGASGDAVAG